MKKYTTITWRLVYKKMFRKISNKTVFTVVITATFMYIVQNKNIPKRDTESQENAIILQQSLMNSLERDFWNYKPAHIMNRTVSVIFSSWRAGSTFLGDIINTVPGTYYHYEPFNYRGVRQIETNEKSRQQVTDLINCRFGSDSAKKHLGVDEHWYHNKRLFRYCDFDLCKRVEFREKFCRIFPRQLMKLVRARVSLAETLLDSHIDVKIILEVRDPRAVYLSRKSLQGCSYHPHCHSIEQYCKFLVQDFNVVQSLRARYPSRVKTLRYEDLAKNPYEVTEQLFSFLNLPYTKKVQEFLESHTTHSKGDIFSTYRDSKSTVVRWMKYLKVGEIEYIQGVCREAIKLWGYKILENDIEEVGVDFNPIETSIIH